MYLLGLPFFFLSYILILTLFCQLQICSAQVITNILLNDSSLFHHKIVPLFPVLPNSGSSYLSTPHRHPQCQFMSSLKLRIHCLPSAFSNWPFQISHSINIYTKNTVPTQQVDDNWGFKSSNDHDSVKYSTKDSYYFKSTVIPFGMWATCNNQIALPAIKPSGVNQDSNNTLGRITVHRRHRETASYGTKDKWVRYNFSQVTHLAR